MNRLLSVKQIGNDLLRIGILATVCACIGLAGNQLRDRPLPLLYQSKQERLDTTVESMAQAGVTHPVEAAQTITTKQLPPILSLDKIQKIVDQDEMIVLDARPGIFYRLGHIPGALSLPRDDFQTGYDQIKSQLEANKNQPLVVYCSSSSCQDSGLIVSALEKLGFGNISIFKGGWAAWQGAGLPEETGQ